VIGQSAAGRHGYQGISTDTGFLWEGCYDAVLDVVMEIQPGRAEPSSAGVNGSPGGPCGPVSGPGPVSLLDPSSALVQDPIRKRMAVVVLCEIQCSDPCGVVVGSFSPTVFNPGEPTGSNLDVVICCHPK